MPSSLSSGKGRKTNDWSSDRSDSTMFKLLRPPTTVYPLAFITFLCTASYFLRIYLHARGNGPQPNSTTITSIPCHTSSNFHKSSVELDFSSHHSADDMVKLTSRTFPSCDAKYSEYTPCEDRDRSLGFPRDRLIYRERHCPGKNELLKCLVPAPFGYRSPFRWPVSRDKAWFSNVPHKELTVEKAGQNWIRVDGKIFRFPGGGTMFPRGADAYIDEIAELVPLKDGSIRTAVDTGCGVASFGAYLMPRNITTMSFAPRDTHEAQVQFALERGVPAIIGVIASIRLPYPSKAFDMAHCSRCLIPWHLDNGQYLIEVDRILRPGGYWILSGPPINWQAHWKGWNRTRDDLKAEQDAIEAVAARLCWKKLKQKGDIAVWQKPINHMECKGNPNAIRFCPDEQDSDKAWYTKLNTCITPLPEVNSIQEPAGGKLKNWPERLTAVPPRIQTGSLEGITPAKFLEDSKLWKKRVRRYESLNGNLVNRSYRNILDMNSYLGGFAAALASDPVWVMNIVPTAEVDTLGVVYQRGLIGTYQDWCEAMSTYPRTYDLIHANAVFTLYQNRCEMEDILLEMDRILRPEGAVIFRDDVDILMKVKTITDGMKWETQFVDHEDGPLEREKILMAKKQYWTLPKTL